MEEVVVEVVFVDVLVGEEEVVFKFVKKFVVKKLVVKWQIKKQCVKDVVVKNVEKDVKVGKVESWVVDLVSWVGVFGFVEMVFQIMDVLQVVESLVEQIEQFEFIFGGVLVYIYSEGLYKSFGYNGKWVFVNYVDECLGIQYCKVMYFIEIYLVFIKLGILESCFVEIGWLKVKELVKIEDLDMVMDLFEYVKMYICMEFVQYIKESVIDVIDGVICEWVWVVKFIFNLIGDVVVMIEIVLKSVENFVGVFDVNLVFEFIVIEWMIMMFGIEVLLEDVIWVLEV